MTSQPVHTVSPALIVAAAAAASSSWVGRSRQEEVGPGMPTGRAQRPPAQRRPELPPRPPPPAAAAPREGTDATARSARLQGKQAAKPGEAPSSKHPAEWPVTRATRERTEESRDLMRARAQHETGPCRLPAPLSLSGHVKRAGPRASGLPQAKPDSHLPCVWFGRKKSINTSLSSQCTRLLAGILILS